MNLNDMRVLKYNAVKNHNESYTRKHALCTDIENHSIRRNEWIYQATRERSTYHISIQTTGEYYELKDEKFKELEYEYFRDIWEVISNER